MNNFYINELRSFYFEICPLDKRCQVVGLSHQLIMEADFFSHLEKLEKAAKAIENCTDLTFLRALRRGALSSPSLGVIELISIMETRLRDKYEGIIIRHHNNILANCKNNLVLIGRKLASRLSDKEQHELKKCLDSLPGEFLNRLLENLHIRHPYSSAENQFLEAIKTYEDLKGKFANGSDETLQNDLKEYVKNLVTLHRKVMGFEQREPQPLSWGENGAL